MDQKRAKTLEALSTYIEAQRALLARTQSDIARLRELRDDITEDPEQTAEVLNEKLHASSSKLSDLRDCMAPLPAGLDWSVFQGHDPTPFKELAATTRRAYASRNEPPPTQRGPPSALQQLVRSARPALDALLASYAPLTAPSASDAEDDEPPDPEEARRAHEREKIRELKQRRLDDPGRTGGLRRPLGSAGVFIRRDQDESADVDISAEHGGKRVGVSVDVDVDMDVDTPPTSVPSPVSVGPGKNPSLVFPAVQEEKPARRRTTKKAEASSSRSKLKGKAAAERAASEDAIEGVVPAEPTKGKGKAKSETYKQAWSVEEQHLLERLLEEIPDGEKNRWSKISQAMSGRRTPRQVASRVQKYFEKLKRFGLDVGGAAS